MVIRIYYVKVGAHFHCRVFIGKGNGFTFALCGTLVFAGSEWDDVRDVLTHSCEIMPEEPRRPTGSDR